MRPVVPLLLLVLPLCRAGEISILQPPRELTDAVNPSSVVSWDADGDGIEELMAFDRLKNRITSSELLPPYPGSPELRVRDTVPFDTNAVPFGTIFNTDINKDGISDLVCAGNGAVEIWYGKPRDLSLPQPPDWRYDYPPGFYDAAEFLPPADLDGDGSPDLVFANQDHFIYGLGTAEPKFLSNFLVYRKQIVTDWDGNGKTVLTGQTVAGGTTVFQVLADHSLEQIDLIPAEGRLVRLGDTFPPQLVSFSDSLHYMETPFVTVYTKTGSSWIPLALPNPSSRSSDLVESSPTTVVFRNPSGRESLAIAGFSYSNIFVVESTGHDPVVSRRPIRSDGRPVIAMSAIDMPGAPGDTLAVFLTRIKEPPNFPFRPPGFLQGSVLSLLRPGIEEPSYSVFGGSAPIGRTIVADIGADGRKDYISLSSGGIATVTNPASRNSSVKQYGLDWVNNTDGLVGGDSPSDNSVWFAVSGNIYAGGIKFFSLDHDTLSTGSNAGPPQSIRALASGDLTGNGIEDVVFIDDLTGTLNHSGSTVPIAVAGRAPIEIRYGITLEEYSFPTYVRDYLTQDQILVTDADEDGDIDVVTFPSALGQRYGFHRNDGKFFSVQQMTSAPGPSGETLDGIATPPPTQIFLGKFLADSPRKTLGAFSPSKESFGNPAGLFTVFTGRVDQSVAVASSNFGAAGRVVVADFDGDGLDDVISIGTRTLDALFPQLVDPTLKFHRSVGDGTFEDGIALGEALAVHPSQLIAEDMNGDGLTDITVVSAEAGTIQLFLSGKVPSHPTFSEWAASHSPSAPGLLESPDGSGIPNLIRFASGEIPSGSAMPAPPQPSSKPEILRQADPYDGAWFVASHPVPRLPNGESLDVKLEYSTDLSEWRALPGEVIRLSKDPKSPQWQVKNWYGRIRVENSDPISSMPKGVFFRFAATYHSGQ